MCRAANNRSTTLTEPPRIRSTLPTSQPSRHDAKPASRSSTNPLHDVEPSQPSRHDAKSANRSAKSRLHGTKSANRAFTNSASSRIPFSSAPQQYCVDLVRFVLVLCRSYSNKKNSILHPVDAPCAE
uniref:Uncharacterized protein n=1 Tax=Caenorhabditis japonica TaxID=281687 RepID=A0A8R1E908_CAEJA